MKDLRSLCTKASNLSKKRQAEMEKQREEAKKRRAMQIGGVYFNGVHPSGVIVILMEEYDAVNGTSEQKLFQWCQKHKVHYYSRKYVETIREDAVLDAQKVGRKAVLINAF